MNLPIRRNKFDVQGFLAYLAEQGCEIGKPTNQYEVVRYRAYWQGSKKPITHIVYAKETGLLTWMSGTQGHYLAFLSGGSITGNKPPYKATFSKGEPATAQEQNLGGTGKSAAKRRKLLERDGTDCWFCGEHMPENDRTIEHLVPKSAGGRNTLANYALAHQRCNAAAADKPLTEKIAIRLEMRGQKA